MTRGKPNRSAFLLYCFLMLLHVCVPLSGAPSPVKLKYSLTPVVHDGQLKLRVVLDMAGITPNRTELVLPSSWGNATRLTGAIVDLRAESPGAQIVDTVHTSVKLLQGYVRGRARVSWYLVKDWDGPLRESVRHRVHLDPNYIEVNTSNALVHPRLDQSAFVDCTFQWNVLPQWSIATSFGAGTRRQTYRGPWDTVENALFVAGDFRIHKLKMGKGSLVVAIRGKWSVPDEQTISQIVNIIRVERAFWKDQDFPYFLVTLVPFGQGQDGSGGGGFTNAFSLHTSPEGTFSAGLLSLLAHEVFHTWNPYKLGRMRSPAEAIYWFTEGFTTYYQDLLLWRAGLLSMENYIQTVNRFLRDYYLSPAKNVSLRELIDREREDQVKGRISYERGAATALWLDSTIRRRTQGVKSLDTLMLDLFREARRARVRFPDLTADRVFRLASRYLGSDDLQRFRLYVESGETIDAPPDAFGPCIARDLVEMPSFELGINRTELVERRTVAGLKPGSEAEKAGLREGDTVIGTSVYWNDTSKPVKLSIRRGKTTSKIEYYPRGPSLGLVPQYAIDKGLLEGDPQRCHVSGAIH